MYRKAREVYVWPVKVKIIPTSTFEVRVHTILYLVLSIPSIWFQSITDFFSIICVFNFRKYSKKKFFFLPLLLLHLNDRSKADNLRSLCSLLNMFDNAFTHPLRELCYMSRRELYTLNFISYFIYLNFTLFTGSLWVGWSHCYFHCCWDCCCWNGRERDKDTSSENPRWWR